MRTEQEIRDKLDAYILEVKKCFSVGDTEEFFQWLDRVNELRWVLGLEEINDI